MKRVIAPGTVAPSCPARRRRTCFCDLSPIVDRTGCGEAWSPGRTPDPIRWEAVMLTKARSISLALALAATAAVPSVALAKHGADDPPGDDRGGQHVEPGDDHGGSGGNGGGGSRGTRVAGTCTDGSTAKLKA